ncbi:hypothetical protein tb265_44330 [Gemmatimonadetes bacterium T265]|nr:hypothetical protein tb265_44330 [Gemmatimonadetes bacterium T265]
MTSVSHVPAPAPFAAPASEPSAEPVLLPASFAQELLWHVNRASPESTAYNIPRARRLRGRLDAAALRRAFDALVERHEVLRTTYAEHDGQVAQAVHPPAPAPFEFIDLGARPHAARADEAARIVAERGARPFDLGRDAPFRTTLIRLADDEHVLCIASHHIAFDGWSRAVLFRELDAFYRTFAEQQEAVLAPLPIQVADHAIWQRQTLVGEPLDRLVAWWRAELGDAEHVLRLPTDFQRPASSRYDSVMRAVLLPPALRDAIRALGGRHGATPYMVVLAAYATVLHRYTGQDDVLVGSPVAGRARPETEGLIGYLANTIVQRARFAGDPTFAALLGRLRESALGAYDHQDVPFEKLVLELEGKQHVGTSPLFQVVLTMLEPGDAAAARIGDVAVEPYASEPQPTKFDLTLFMAERGAGLELALRARADLHRAETVERILGHVRTVLESAAADADVPVSRIPLLTAGERAQLAAWNATTADEGPATTAVALFEAQAARVPDRAAVVGDDATPPLTYAELNARANRLARRLRTLGVGAGAPVGVALDALPDAVVALLGVLKAGGAYVPLPPELPAARRAQQLAASDAALVVTAGAAPADAWPTGVRAVAVDDPTLAAEPAGNLEPVATPASLAYVLFTSGSTGTPKGVAVTHANVVHYTRAVCRVLGVAFDEPADAPARQFGLASTLGADLGNTALYPALLAGHTLHVLPREVATQPARFAARLAARPLDVLKLTPGHWQALTAGLTGPALAAVLPRQWLVLGGEALPLGLVRGLADAARTAGGRVLNHYGPTETTVGVLTAEVTANALDVATAQGAQTTPIGRPLPNTQAYVVDAAGVEQPVGVPGELWIGGAGVAAGYYGQPALTAERFVSFDGVVGDARVYRTGDRVRRLADGTLEFLARVDEQVKIRGYRVEPGEVAHVLGAHPDVLEAFVLARPDEAGEPALVAYAAPRPGAAPAPAVLAAWVADRVPAYMAPSAVVLVDALPRTGNGKVDRAALPVPNVSAGAPRAIAPRTETERQLAAIWAAVLKRESVGVTDSFLDLGGHSLLAIRVLGRMSKTFGVRLPLRALFDAPTVEQLAEVVDLEVRLAALEAMSDDEAAQLLAGEAGSTGR